MRRFVLTHEPLHYTNTFLQKKKRTHSEISIYEQLITLILN